LAFVGELQTTICFVLDHGGIWLNVTTGIGRFRFSGYQLRVMPYHKPRAWKLNPLSRKYKPADPTKVLRRTSSERWKPIQLTLRSAYDIGVGIIIRLLNANIKIGVEGDAALTALLCGALSTLLHTLRSASTRGEFVPRGAVDIRPVFNGGKLSIRFKCILAIKVRHIIREIIENRTGRKNDGKSSDRKYHADNHGKYSQHG
jgi:hypothetical protein